MFAEAIRYAEMGWEVFPVYGVDRGECTCSRKALCASPGKHPIPRRGHKEATTDTTIIEQWANKYENANIGISTGSGSGIIVLDVDKKNDGYGSLNDLIKRHGNIITETLCAETGGGGLHYYFEMPTIALKNTQGRLGPGIDTRANGGYVVGAPSTHISNRKYSWRDGLYTPNPIPQSLIEELLPNQTQRSPRFSLPTLIARGSRNDTLFRYACSLRGSGLDRAEIFDKVQTENQRRCDSKLEILEIQQIVTSACRYKQGRFFPYHHYRNQIVNNRGLGSSDKLILHTLLAHADNETLIAYPSQELIACESGLSRATVNRRISKLKSTGWLKIKQIGRSNGKQGWSNQYQLKLRALGKV